MSNEYDCVIPALPYQIEKAKSISWEQLPEDERRRIVKGLERDLRDIVARMDQIPWDKVSIKMVENCYSDRDIYLSKAFEFADQFVISVKKRFWLMDNPSDW